MERLCETIQIVLATIGFIYKMDSFQTQTSVSQLSLTVQYNMHLNSWHIPRHGMCLIYSIATITSVSRVQN